MWAHGFIKYWITSRSKLASSTMRDPMDSLSGTRSVVMTLQLQDLPGPRRGRKRKRSLSHNAVASPLATRILEHENGKPIAVFGLEHLEKNVSSCSMSLIRNLLTDLVNI